MPKLFLHSAQERGDVAEWMARDGANDEDAPIARWDDALDWFSKLQRDDSAYPFDIAVPPEFVEPLEAIFEDWSEVLFSHSEDFHSHIA